MNKIFWFILIFLLSYFLQHDIIYADTQLWTIPNEKATIQTSSTDFMFVGSVYSWNWHINVYNKYWQIIPNLTLITEWIVDIPWNENLLIDTISLKWSTALIIKAVWNSTMYCIIFKHSDLNIIYKWSLGFYPYAWTWHQYGPDYYYTFINNQLILKTWYWDNYLTFNRETFALSLNTNYILPIESLKFWYVWHNSLSHDANWLTYVWDTFIWVDNITYYPINYIEWRLIWNTIWINKQIQIWASAFPIISYQYAWPYNLKGDKVEYLSLSTNWPYNYYTLWWINTYFNVMTLKKINNWEWAYYNTWPNDSRFYLLFSYASQFYYVNDPKIININYDIGPMVWYIVNTAWAITNFSYLSWWILYNKTDLSWFSWSTADLWIWWTSTNDEYDSSIWDFDKNKDGDISIWEFFSGLRNVFRYFLDRLIAFFANIKNLITQLWWIFTTSEKSFSFDLLSTTYADERVIADMFNTSVNETSYNNSFLWKIDLFFKWFISFFIIIIWISFFIFVNKHRKNG